MFLTVILSFHPSVSVCILDVRSFTVTAAWNFRHNLKHTVYVQHQEEYFQTIILPFCDYNCEMEKIFKNIDLWE